MLQSGQVFVYDFALSFPNMLQNPKQPSGTEISPCAPSPTCKDLTSQGVYEEGIWDTTAFLILPGEES